MIRIQCLGKPRAPGGSARRRLLCCAFAVAFVLVPATAGERGDKVQYVGGTVKELADGPKGKLYTSDDLFLEFRSKKVSYPIAWSSINLVEYGQKVGRRYAMAIVISPLLMLSKSRKHFVTIGFVDEQGRQQAMIFRVDKNDVRSLLVCLEAKADLNVEYQDEEARKTGKD